MKNGLYELIVAPECYPGKRYRGRYAYEHHVVYWEKYSVVPGPGDVVHHKNEKKRDNRIENLELMRAFTHTSNHNRNRVEMIKVKCFKCLVSFDILPGDYKRRVKQNGSDRLFCSRSCQVSVQQVERRSSGNNF